MLCRNDILNTIGNTPVVKLRGNEKGASIYAKLEMFNPGGSVKDRPAMSMILDAERRELLSRNTTVIEATSGNAGIALAMICAVRGYRCVIIMPDNMSVERRMLIEAYGAEIELTPADDGMKGAIERLNELAVRLPDSFIPDQFNNPANPRAHETGTGPEIIEALGTKIDAFVAGIGTGGTITGVGRVLKQANPDVRIIGIEPAESAVLNGNNPGKHTIQGIGAGFIPKILDMGIIDRIVTTDSNTALKYTKLLTSREGVFGGISSGAAYSASIQIANELGGDSVVVTLFPDNGCKYITTGVF